MTTILLASSGCAEPHYPIHQRDAARAGFAVAKPQYPTHAAPAAGPIPVAPAPPPAAIAADESPRAAPSGNVDSADLPPAGSTPGAPGGLLSHVIYDGDAPPSLFDDLRLDDGLYRGGRAGLLSIALRHRHNWHAETSSSHKAKGRHAKHAAAAADRDEDSPRKGKRRHATRTAHAESRRDSHSKHAAKDTRGHHAARASTDDEDSGTARETRSASLKVRRGESLAQLAKRAGVSESELRKLNGLKRHARLKAGEVLKTAAAEPAHETARSHSKAAAYTVKRGDTLYGVARKYGVKPAELAELNGFKVSKGLHRGQHLKLPAGDDTVEESRPVRVAQAAAPRSGHGPHRADATLSFASAGLPRSGVVLPTPVQRPEPPSAQPPVSPPVQPGRMTSAWADRAGLATQGPVASVSQAGRPVPLPTAPHAATRYGSSTAPPAPYAVASANLPKLNPPSTTGGEASGRGRFVWPLKGPIVAGFGDAGQGQRGDGIDIAVQPGDSVRAAAAGEVVYAGSSIPGFGNLVLVKHPGGWTTAYAHLQRLGVRIRDTVAQGQEIGLAGESVAGRPILHFEVRYTSDPTEKARPIDPMSVLPAGS